MDSKKNPMRRTKRSSKAVEEKYYWDCSVCTFRNTAEAFKCLMCDVRKGTSTRKPRINPQLVAQQVPQSYVSSQPSTSKGANKKNASGKNSSKKKRFLTPRLKNVDRSSAVTREVTVNSVTVVITEYKPIVRKQNNHHSSERHSSSASSSEHSESSMDTRS